MERKEREEREEREEKKERKMHLAKVSLLPFLLYFFVVAPLFFTLFAFVLKDLSDFHFYGK